MDCDIDLPANDKGCSNVVTYKDDSKFYLSECKTILYKNSEKYIYIDSIDMCNEDNSISIRGKYTHGATALIILFLKTDLNGLNKN